MIPWGRGNREVLDDTCGLADRGLVRLRQGTIEHMLDSLRVKLDGYFDIGILAPSPCISKLGEARAPRRARSRCPRQPPMPQAQKRRFRS